MQDSLSTCVKQNNDHTQIMRKKRFQSSFSFYVFQAPFKLCG